MTQYARFTLGLLFILMPRLALPAAAAAALPGDGSVAV